MDTSPGTNSSHTGESAEKLIETLVAAVKPRFRLISGNRLAGKTTWCENLYHLARERGLDVAGLISPAVFTDGRKSAIDLVDLRTTTRKRLAVARDPQERTENGRRWLFSHDTLHWGNRVLAAIDSCDLLIIDEIGPMEWTHGQGLYNAFTLIERRAFTQACIVVRPSLMERAIERWPEALPITIGASES